MSQARLSNSGPLAIIVGAALLASAGPSLAQQVICGDRDLALVNGEIHTMMEEGLVESVLMRDGRVLAVDDIGDPGPCTDVVDLEGHTAIPGLIDNHVHFIRVGNRPGYDLRAMERAFTVDAAQAAIEARAAEVPAGALITAVGGIQAEQFAEGRLPTLEELDAAAPDNPFYMSANGFGPGRTNTLGRNLLRERGVEVADDGSVARGDSTARAYDVLFEDMSVQDRSRQLRDLQAHALSIGLTTVMDQSGTVPGVGFVDPATGYEPFLTLVRDGTLKIRVRVFFPALDEAGEENRQLAGYLDNKWHDYGPDPAKVVGIGEWAVGRSLFGDALLTDEVYAAMEMIAERGWPYHQHVISEEEIDAHLQIWEALTDKGYDLAALGWSLGHLNGITVDEVERANALGVGLGLHAWRYLFGGEDTGPPYRMVLDNATVPLGAGSDGARISTLDPWLMIYHMVTGRNNATRMVNDGQQITREEAIGLYTGADQGFFSHELGLLGGIGVDRYADVVVLDRDFFDESAVSDDEIRTISSVLTIVGGRIVHDAGVLDTP